MRRKAKQEAPQAAQIAERQDNVAAPVPAQVPLTSATPAAPATRDAVKNLQPESLKSAGEVH